MLVPVLLFIVGLVLLIKGGDWFVDGATGIAHHFHIPDLLIGATVVSIGTTLPEVMVSATSAVSGHGEIAYGNALGSIICNTALISAITIAIKPCPVKRETLKTPVMFFFIAAAFYCTVAYTSGHFSRGTGRILVCMFLVYIGFTVYQMQKASANGTAGAAAAVAGENFSEEQPYEEKASGEEPSMVKNLIMLVAGAAFIAVGANLLVDNGTLIAQALGVPEAVIALTFVALGTSLPELVTAISSLVKGHGALSLGNIIGANLFNLVLVSGVSSALAPFDIPANAQIAGINSSLVVDVPVMLFVMLLLTAPTMIRGKLSRVQGIVLLLIYAGFCVFQFTL